MKEKIATGSETPHTLLKSPTTVQNNPSTSTVSTETEVDQFLATRSGCVIRKPVRFCGKP